MSGGQLLLFASAELESWATREARAAGLEVRVASTPKELVTLALQHLPRAVVVDLTRRDGTEAMQLLRARRETIPLPVFAAAARLNDAAFARAYLWGCDDVVHVATERALERRLRALPEALDGSASTTVGTVLIAHPQPARAFLLGRTFQQAGFQPQYALKESELLLAASTLSPHLVLYSHELGDLTRVMGPLQLETPGIPWIVTVPSNRVESLRIAYEGRPGLAIVSETDPQEQLLFLANELLEDPGRELRVEQRLLFGTLVSFRGAGANSDEHGFTFNVSPNGLFVRTMVVPEEDRVWLELLPPGETQRVRLEGKVVWRCGFRQHGRGSSPSGYGLRLEGGLGDARRLWESSVQRLREEQAAAQRLPEQALMSLPPRAGATSTMVGSGASLLPLVVGDGAPVDIIPMEAGRRTGAGQPPPLPGPAVHGPPPLPGAAVPPPLPVRLRADAPPSSPTDRALRLPSIVPTIPPDVPPRAAARQDRHRSPSPHAPAPPQQQERAGGAGHAVPSPAPAPPASDSPAAPHSPRRHRTQLVVLVVSAGALVAAYLWSPQRWSAGPPASPPLVAGEPSSSPRPAAPPSADGSAGSVAASAASAATSASSETTPEEAPTPTAEQLATLTAHRAILRVDGAPLGATVYLSGKKAGPAGKPLEVPCGAHRMRVGLGRPVRWLADEERFTLPCREFTVRSLPNP